MISPSFAHSSGVVRMSVTWRVVDVDVAVLEASPGAVSRGPKLTMSRAPSETTWGMPACRPQHRGAPGRRGRTPPTSSSHHSVVVRSHYAAEIAVSDQRFEGPAAAADGVEDEHLVARPASIRLAETVDARRGDAEHRGADERLVRDLRHVLLDHAGHGARRRWRRCGGERRLSPETSTTECIMVMSLHADVRGRRCPMAIVETMQLGHAHREGLHGRRCRWKCHRSRPD